MGRISATLLKRLGHIARAVIILLVLVGWAQPGSAQNAGAMQPLVEQLLRASEAGFARDGGAGGALDGARAPAAAGEFEPPLIGPAPIPIMRSESTLTKEELLLVHRFCEGQLPPGEMKELVLVPAFSPLEQDFCSRVGGVLLQFGYDMFDGPRLPSVLVNGAIPETYRLGIGDELVITFRGQTSSTVTTAVDREGRVILSDLDPIPAAGRTFGDFKDELEARVAAALLGTDVFASLGAVRAVSVSVIGEVHMAGVHQLTGLSTILDALANAGGIKKTGSLRRIRVERANTFFWIDLYDLLINGTLDQDLALYEGDRILVPILGPTVAVAGKVLRPGIFELAEGEATPSVAQVVALAGDPIRPRGARLSHRTLDAAGRELIVETMDPQTSAMMAGDIVEVNFGEDVQVGTVRLEGHVRLPGSRARASAPTVHALIGGAESFEDGAYLPFAVLETTEPATQARRLFAIDLQRILAGQQDFALRDNDRLVVLNMEDVRFLSSNLVQAVVAQRPDISPAEPVGEVVRLQGNIEALNLENAKKYIEALEENAERLVADLEAANRKVSFLAAGEKNAEIWALDPSSSGCRGLGTLRSIVEVTQSGRFNSAIQAMNAARADGAGARVEELDFSLTDCPSVYNDLPDLLPFALEHVVAINGEVRRPGAYPITENTSIASMVSVAGGLTLEADLAMVEITRFGAGSQGGNLPAARTLADLTGQGAAGVTLNPGDVVRFNAVFSDRDSGPILLAGEFVRPGLYDIRRGERLSEVVARAGGLTQQAYPYGAVFTRESVKRAEKAGLLRAVQDLNSSIALAATRQGVRGDAIVAVRDIVAELASTEPLGRVVMEANPTVLQVRPELDAVLQPGDTLFMPKRPNSVLIIGDVLNPGAQQFVAGTKAEEYIVRAGGLQDSADPDRLFLVYPNGEAQPLNFSVWNYSSVQVPPGSTIVSPRNPAPLNLLGFARDLTALISQLAITAASIAVIGN